MGKLPFTLQGFSTLVYNFDTQLFPNVAALKSSCTSISGTVSSSKNSMSSAANGITSGWSSEAGVSVKGALQNPIIEGLSRVDTSMNGSLSSIIGKIEALGTPVSEIKAMIDKANTLKEGEWVEHKSIFGRVSKDYEKNDDDLIAKYSDSITAACSLVESSINSLASLSSESLGIVGNICGGNPLGSYTPMDLSGVNTNITISAVEPEKSLFAKIAGNVGSFVVGVVEAPFKLVEGVVDAGATLVADVVSLVGGDASGIVTFIEKDHVGDTIDSVLPFVKEYDTARNLGKNVGAFAVNAATVYFGGPLAAAVKAIGNAGRTSETMLNISDGNLVLATAAGTVVGYLDYKLTTAGQKKYGKSSRTTTSGGTGGTGGTGGSTQISGNLPAPGDTVGSTQIAGNLPASGDAVGSTQIAGNLPGPGGTVEVTQIPGGEVYTLNGNDFIVADDLIEII